VVCGENEGRLWAQVKCVRPNDGAELSGINKTIQIYIIAVSAFIF